MIITRLRGGLGNQLFQYACGRALSLRTDNSIRLDVEGYAKEAQEKNRKDTQRSYSLSHFNIRAEIATSEEIRAFKYPLGIISKGWRFAKVKIFRQFNTGFIPKILSKRGDVYLDGYWQTELYFNDHEKEIRADFTLKNPLGSAAADVAAQIRGAESVSIHVRRGDVARDAATNPYFGISTPDYYAAAINHIVSLSKNTNENTGKSINSPRFFVFTDDVAWVKENIKIPEPCTFVSGKNIPDYEELVLMSLCRHNIIANSSYSWWGAWLNANPEKIIIAPKEWVNGAHNRKMHKDTVPSAWIRL